MSSTTMHFGPEWMRTKHQPSTRSHQPPSPPPSTAPSSASTYSALVSTAPPPQPERRDEVHPFRYSRDELLRIYRENNGRGGLGLEVERWEGVVREVGSEPIGLREMNDYEKKLFHGPLNSDLRRRQSTDYLSPLATQSLGPDRSRMSLNSPASATGSPLRDRFGALRRRDSTEQPTITIPRKQSLSTLPPSQASPRDTTVSSPRRSSAYTPSFDGVLSSGESWVARRRASEASLKAGSGAGRDVSGDFQTENKGTEIPEEAEEEAASQKMHTANDSVEPATASGDEDSPLPGIQDPSTEISNLPINNGSNTVVTFGSPLTPTGPIDYARIEWSYKDPSGQVQGPFNSELMQKWFDDGYFTGDLPMKRTHLDANWITVDQLIKEHGGSKIFLTPPVPSLPPGLSTHRAESPQHVSHPQEQPVFNGPLQPAPLRNLRSSTLESYSNTSDSPASSFGGGRFNNESPDTNAFGSRGVYFGGDNSGHIQSFSGIPDPAIAFNTRNAFNDPSIDPSLGSHSTFANISNRGPISDGLGCNRTYIPTQNGWAMPLNNTSATFDDAISPVIEHSSFPSNYVNGAGSTTSYGNPGTSQDNGFGDNTSFHPLDFNQYINGVSPAHLYSTIAPYTDSQHLQHTVSTSSLYEQQIATSQANPPIAQLSKQTPNPSHSPWISEGHVPRRPGPFEAPHPTSTNTMVVQPISSSPWERVSEPSRPSSQTNDSSWPTPSQSLNEESWKDTPTPDSLTFSNVGQHNEQQQRLAAASAATSTDVQLFDTPQPTPVFEPSAPVDVSKAAPPTKPKSKAYAPATQPPALKHLVLQLVSEPTPPVSASKVAWLKDDDNKEKPFGSSISLREIQEVEAKKAEARKAAERERERAARTVAPAMEVKESPSFTASWGLPTSQAGVAPRVNGFTKDAIQPPATPATPVWTTAVKGNMTKKSMKEIQEEEEKRRKNVVKESSAAVARRAYADTSPKVVASPVQGGAWTTVGPSGKVTPNPPSTRSVITPSSSTSSVTPPIRSNGTPAARPVSASTAVATPPRPEEPVSPSHDFLKWLSSSLKGLNSSVNVEEIVSMLLSFPMDPDPSTVELISELIYANSTILDGRRFAAEFISKRKADAASKPKTMGTAGKAPAKPISIADVVKAVPKPTQAEWGFKVVNKKKKGGRA